MRTIKFRGKSKHTGEIVFGDLLQYKGRPAIIYSAGELIYSAVLKEGLRGLTEVEPESVAQLIGYDKNGKEIYSDDKVDVDSEIHYRIYAEWVEYQQVGDTFENWTLREVEDDDEDVE